MTPCNIDNIISAEIPKEDDPLREVVIKTMVHGPCGSLNPILGCTEKGRCKQNYPREFCNFTEITDDAFPKYRRRSPEHGGQIAHKYFRGTRWEIDNRNIVPYSPYILRKYGCHNNAEFCASITLMKYLFKYHFKGHDMVTVENAKTIIDEVHNYKTKQYVSSCEACWRIYEFDTVKLKPSILQLSVHLENQQTVIYNNNQNDAQMALKTNQIMQLMAYFTANQDFEEAQTVKYEDFPKFFVWNTGTKTWTKRQRITNIPTQIGQMVAFHPSQDEKFYLCLLLKHKSSSTSYSQLHTVNQVQHPTFKAACISLGLLQDDQQWFESMTKATLIAFPSSIRNLFCNILLCCTPSDPLGLFNAFADKMKGDFLRKHRKNLTH